jgi:hypothetical protein
MSVPRILVGSVAVGSAAFGIAVWCGLCYTIYKLLNRLFPVMRPEAEPHMQSIDAAEMERDVQRYRDHHVEAGKYGIAPLFYIGKFPGVAIIFCVRNLRTGERVKCGTFLGCKRAREWASTLNSVYSDRVRRYADSGTCPHCDGQGLRHERRFANRVRSMPCPHCGGTGSIRSTPAEEAETVNRLRRAIADVTPPQAPENIGTISGRRDRLRGRLDQLRQRNERATAEAVAELDRIIARTRERVVRREAEAAAPPSPTTNTVPVREPLRHRRDKIETNKDM